MKARSAGCRAWISSTVNRIGKRVLQLVRGLARQRLPAGHLGQYESLLLLPQLVGHVVERFERFADLIARAFPSLATGRRRVQSPAANALSAAVSC